MFRTSRRRLIYDGHLNDSASTTAIARAGIGALRYPGGSIADAYRWQTNTMVLRRCSPWTPT